MLRELGGGGGGGGTLELILHNFSAEILPSTITTDARNVVHRWGRLRQLQVYSYASQAYV